jgi:virginiamycin B lyase
MAPKTGAVIEYPLSSNGSGPDGICVGQDGYLWFTESYGNRVAKISSATGIITEYPITTANSQPTGITMDNDGNVWFTEALSNIIGRVGK